MGCLFTCFRIRDNNNKRHLGKTTAATTTAAVPSRHNKRNVCN
jgi:hypothetical protein